MQDLSIEIDHFGVEVLCRFGWKEFESHWRVYTNQQKEDHIAEQLELELEDPFTGKRK